MNFTIKHGADFRVAFRFLDGEGDVIDFTGFTAAFRAFYRGVEINKDTSELFDAADQDEGMIHLHINEDETRLVPLGRLMRWAIEIREPGDTPPGGGDQVVLEEMTGYLEGVQGLDNAD